VEENLIKLEVFSAFLIIIAAGYWYINPDANIEPLIVLITSGVVIIGSLFKRFALNEKEHKKSTKPVEITILSSEIRCYKEDIDYGIKLDLELFFTEKCLLKNLSVKYKEPHHFGENQSQRSHIMYVKYVSENILEKDLNLLIQNLEQAEAMPKLPATMETKSLLQLTVSGYIPGKRLPDGWEGVALKNWTLVVGVDNEQYELPVIFNKHADTLKRPVKWVEVGFIDA
tara:strand:- start:51 stop:734 length:684 start_codon:yes stop_codon:yes gene_type:complete